MRYRAVILDLFGTLVDSGPRRHRRHSGVTVADEPAAEADPLALTRRWVSPCIDVTETLAWLNDVGFLLALITNCHEAVPEIWAETTLAGHFRVAVFSCACGMSKPERGIYMLAADRLGVKPHQCVFVDDRVRYLEGASGVGMHPIRMQWADPHLHHTSHHEQAAWLGDQIGTLSELRGILAI